jgi:hypothetical protein
VSLLPLAFPLNPFHENSFLMIEVRASILDDWFAAL